MRWKHALALVWCFMVGAAGADSWLPPSITAHASPTGLWVVRVTPGSDKGTVFGFGGDPRGPAAKAVLHRLRADGNYTRHKEFQLLNPVAPVFAAITDSGELITLDNWHNMGIGQSVVAIYSPEGGIVRSLGLMDIYSPAELEKFRMTVSSIWWRCAPEPVLDARKSTLEFMDALGGSVEITLKSGEVKRSPGSQTGC